VDPPFIAVSSGAGVVENGNAGRPFWSQNGGLNPQNLWQRSGWQTITVCRQDFAMALQNKSSQVAPIRSAHDEPRVMDPAQVFKKEEIAARLKVRPRVIYQLTRTRIQDRIPHFKVGRQLRFYWPDVSAWLFSQRKAA
jgi:hypothetical protein